MDDWLDSINKYRHIKEFADLCEDVLKLRNYHNSHQDADMMNHIRLLMVKYPEETINWNSSHCEAPKDLEQEYWITEEFLRSVAFVKLSKMVAGSC